MVQHTREPVYFVDAVERITSRLPSAIWLEAGSSSLIIAMTHRVTTLQSGRSDVFISMELGNSDAITHLAEAACQLWTAGSAARHWLFNSSSRYRYTNLNLPPYQFEKSRHWIENKPRSEPITKEKPNLISLLNKDGASTGEHRDLRLHVRAYALRNLVVSCHDLWMVWRGRTAFLVCKTYALTWSRRSRVSGGGRIISVGAESGPLAGSTCSTYSVSGSM